MADGISIPELSHTEALSIFAYDPETGVLRWRVARGRQPAGSLAGTPKEGYLSIRVMGTIVRAHRLIWFIMTGTWPPAALTIDHINRDRADNRWSNLRLASIGENSANQSIRSDNSSGAKGVYAHRNGRFYAFIEKGHRRFSLGGFDTLDEAKAARQAADNKFFGEFAAN